MIFFHSISCIFSFSFSFPLPCETEGECASLGNSALSAPIGICYTKYKMNRKIWSRRTFGIDLNFPRRCLQYNGHSFPIAIKREFCQYLIIQFQAVYLNGHDISEPLIDLCVCM